MERLIQCFKHFTRKLQENVRLSYKGSAQLFKMVHLRTCGRTFLALGIFVSLVLIPSTDNIYAQESISNTQILLPIIQNGTIESSTLPTDGTEAFNAAKNVDPDLVIALEAAIKESQHDDQKLAIKEKIAGIEQHGDIAIAYAIKSIGGVATGHPHVVMAQYEKPEWKIIFDDDKQFNALVEKLPSDPYDEIIKSMIKVESTNEIRAAAARPSGYRLPWTKAHKAYITTPYGRHGIGQIDFDVSSENVLAAKDGHIVYINDSNTLEGGWHWKHYFYNNVVVIEHAPREYTLYLHLKHNSVPSYLKKEWKRTKRVFVKRSTVIGKEGSTGRSSAPHLHLSTTTSYGIYSSNDWADQDGDGNRSERIETAWSNAHRAVNFGEASYEQLKWKWGEIISQNTPSNSNNSSSIAQNIRAKSGRTYTLDTCKEGGKYYSDRNYKITRFTNSDYKNRPCIITANDDKGNGSSDFLTFTLNKPATIRIFVDSRMDRKPSWFGNKYNKNSKKVYTTDNGMKYFDVYTCDANPGTIVLGGAQKGSKGIKSMYVVQIKEITKGRTDCSTN